MDVDNGVTAPGGAVASVGIHAHTITMPQSRFTNITQPHRVCSRLARHRMPRHMLEAKRQSPGGFHLRVPSIAPRITVAYSHDTRHPSPLRTLADPLPLKPVHSRV